MDDEAILTLYFARDQEAIRETDRKYGAYCRRISQQILGSREDAEECVNDTWLQAWNKIPPQRQLDIRSRKKIIVCEYCGRIMIDPELAGVAVDTKVEAAKEKPTRRRKITSEA